MEKTAVYLTIISALFIVFCSTSVSNAWMEPMLVTEVNSEFQDYAPFLSYDGLTLYFSRSETDTFFYNRIYQATRTTASGEFTSVEEISVLNYSEGSVSSAWVSPDNLKMYYYRTEPGSNHRIKMTERTSASDPWQTGSNVDELNALGNVSFLSLTPDELTMVFTGENMAGGLGSYDLYIGTRDSTSSAFGDFTNLTNLNSTVMDANPFITSDGLELYFDSYRNGTRQLFKSTRASLTDPFGDPMHFSVFDSPNSKIISPCLSSDGSSFYFAKSIDGGDYDLYVSQIPEPATLLLVGIGGIILRRTF